MALNSKSLSIAGVFALALGLLAYLWTSPTGLQAAPSVQLDTLNGESVTLESLRGQPVLVNFWATTCPGCIKEMPHLAELYDELKSDGLKMYGVAMFYDPPEDVKALVEARQLPYDVVLDTQGNLAKAFGDVSLTPTTFLIDPSGNIALKKLGEVDMHKLEVDIRNMLKG